MLPRADNTDELRVVDLETRDERQVVIPSNTRVDSLRFSPVGNELVFVADENGDEELVTESQPSERFFDDPVVSQDDRYVLVEAAPTFSKSVDYIGNRQPEGARLVLYDRFASEVIESDTRGVDPVWNR